MPVSVYILISDSVNTMFLFKLAISMYLKFEAFLLKLVVGCKNRGCNRRHSSPETNRQTHKTATHFNKRTEQIKPKNQKKHKQLTRQRKAEAIHSMISPSLQLSIAVC